MMYIFISLFRAVCTLVLLEPKKKSVIVPKENSGLYQESAPRLLMVTQCLSLDLHWTLKAEIGSRNAVVVRALASRQYGPGLIPVLCHMWVEAIVCYRFAQRVFSEFLVFSLHKNPVLKPTSPNSNSNRIEDLHKNQLRLMFQSGKT